MKSRRGLGISLLGAGLAVLSCSADRGSVPAGASADASVSSASVGTLVESSAAASRIAELRARFRLAVRSPEDNRPGLAHAARANPLVPTTTSALGVAVATGFEAAAGPDAASYVRAVLPAEALRGVTRPAHVALPLRADGEVKLEDETSHLSVRFTLEHVQNARIEVSGGMVLYRGALDGADVVHRVHAEGTEDFVVFETRPAHEELSYSVDVSRVPGLRLVSNTLEFMDTNGTPVLRVAPPYVVDASGQRHDAKIALTGCAYDTSPAGPWGRKATKPGADRCTVRVVWAAGIAYPAMVDPAWGATGSMATARMDYTASQLLSGNVLVVGGYGGGGYLASAELYDPAGNAGAGTFAATGSMAIARWFHTASVLPSGKVLVAGGANDPNNGAFSSAELYDPAGNAGAGTFAATGSMASKRSRAAASVLATGKVLVVGGEAIGLGLLASAELFDPAGNAGAGTFAATGSMSTGREMHTTSVLASGRVLVAGGYGGAGLLANAEVYDPSGNAGAGTFAATGSMFTARSWNTASVLPSGKVLFVGGYSASTTLASAELYDPAGNAGAGTFAATGSMFTARGDHTASVLPSGKVLVAGGANSGALASAELFDPAGNAGAGAFSTTGSLVTTRGAHTASMLPSGKVLVAGGSNGNFLSSAELYGGALGDPCSTSCLSGFCADGVCCDTACNGTCQACAAALKQSGLADGTCGPIKDGTDPHNQCPPSGVPCGADGYCNGAGACRVVTPAGVSCGAGVCQGTVARGQLCDGVGTCAANGAGVECAPFLCANGGCTTSCVTSSECAPSAWCKAGTCIPRASNGSACLLPEACSSGFCADGVCCDKACTGQCEACDSVAGACGPIAGNPHGTRPACSRGSECSATTNRCESDCDGDHTTKSANGPPQDCTPYKCDLTNGACRTACSSISDCVAPDFCDPTGKCMPPSGDTMGGGGGCSVVSAGVGDAGGELAWLATVAALALVRRRRTRWADIGRS